jgi:MATE family multidrug resistance protein
MSLSATLGTDVLAENSLLQQVIFLIAFFIEGIGFTTETLTGNFQGQSAKNQLLLPLLQIAIFTSLLVAVAASGLCILLPETVFGLVNQSCRSHRAN